LIKTKRMGFHSKTFQQMVQDVRNLVENKQLREEMGEKSQKFAFKTFSISNINEFINLIEQTCDGTEPHYYQTSSRKTT